MSKALKMGARQTPREIVFSLINNQWLSLRSLIQMMV
jgi:hypothetical protein